ncbi:MAG: hypothetical protein OWR52_12560 [Acidibacillus sp.]|nr:hypothetical protein [Acidibacillus sp.]
MTIIIGRVSDLSHGNGTTYVTIDDTPYVCSNDLPDLWHELPRNDVYVAFDDSQKEIEILRIVRRSNGSV